MKNYKMAWRNLWRNRRRTMITAASVLFAVFFALMFRSLQLGSYGHMFKNAIESYSGYVQVQQSEWWDDRTVDNSLSNSEELKSTLLNDENVQDLIPRFESFALASNGPKTKGVMVMGIDPEKETLLSSVYERKIIYTLTGSAIDSINKHIPLSGKTAKRLDLLEGKTYSTRSRLLSDFGLDPEKDQHYIEVFDRYASCENGDIRIGDPGVWLGEKLASYLDLQLGDTLVLLGQGYHGSTAAGKYPVRGIIRMPIPDIDARIVYIPFDIAQNLYNAPGQLTSLVIHVDDNSDKAIDNTLLRIDENLPENTRAMGWREMNELLINQMDADNKSGIIMIAILYLVIAFGVFGTVLMMTAERRREFGVLVAIGMQKKKLATIITYEMLYIGLLGMAMGAIVGIIAITIGVYNPIVFKGEMAVMFEDYGMEPIMKFSPAGVYFFWQSVIVALMVLLSLFYPLRKVMNLKVVNALKA